MCLNLGIAFSSIGVGSIISLLLNEPSKSLHKFVVVIVITVISLIAGIVLLAIWTRLRKQASDVIDRIRRRAIPSAGGTVMDAPAVEDKGHP
jgi:general stress protein CsbA